MRYPHVEVQLSGMDGNSASIIARVCRALRRAGVSEAEIDEYVQQAHAGDYKNVWNVTEEWVQVS